MSHSRTAYKPNKRVERCGMTRKRMFKSVDDALQRAADIMDSGEARTNVFRAYECGYCGQFHLTSKV